MRVRLIIRVNDCGLPALVTVRNRAGRLLYCKRTCSRVVFANCCTKDRLLAVSVKPLDFGVGEVTQYLRLSARPCQIFGLYFGFDEVLYFSEQKFTLFDENYGFPVINAVLNFFGR